MRQVIEQLVDDLDGSVDGVRTYTFTLQDVTYAIDLSDDNADAFYAAFHRYITAGRRLPRRPYATSTSPVWAPDTTSRQYRNNLIRAWWARNERTLRLPPYRPTGRIPKKVRAAYGAKH